MKNKIKKSWVLGLIIGVALLLTVIIPIIQISTFLPILLLAEGFRKLISNDSSDLCIKAYELTSLLLKIVAVTLSVHWSRKVYINPKFNLNKEIYQMMAVYIITNAFLAIDLITPKHCCFGDGQTILGIFFSAPFASLAPIILGLVFEFTRNMKIKDS